MIRSACVNVQCARSDAESSSSMAGHGSHIPGCMLPRAATLLNSRIIMYSSDIIVLVIPGAASHAFIRALCVRAVTSLPACTAAGTGMQPGWLLLHTSPAVNQPRLSQQCGRTNHHSASGSSAKNLAKSNKLQTRYPRRTCVHSWSLYREEPDTLPVPASRWWAQAKILESVRLNTRHAASCDF
ncbi:hypothetical protein EJ05DRAFT_483495 [Pseudovirgaria hyperparasitica]|uniref:Uncharacterized protein n=1 Tax=Pseudovirgaria hyperparasitica TaxID=470096 RepID=A0A6A6WFX4_9PEZI|nr:uncharacterized protein EJ05DRAFT_483495 [Pseudovirgaria hyperparasitica]KAF2761089.1 hypothetical protein EJ05DRAFT_483495 [Pseudovirgaria hyperparasitica]